MKAWAIEKYGDNSAVKLMHLAVPEPEADEIQIQMKAASINPVDFKIRSGELKSIKKFKFPLIMGNDGAGVVSKTGKNITKFKVGDEVFVRMDKDKVGALCEYCVVKESSAAFKPKNISFTEAASLPLVGLTSWQVLLERAQLKRGDRVLIPAGSGGIGTFAIQLAKHFGAYVITNTSGKNVSFVKSLGADEVVNYQTDDFSKMIEPVDTVYDTMGGETQKKAFSVLKKGGKLISIVGPPTRHFAIEAEAPLVIQLGAGLLSLPTHLRAKKRGATYEFLFMKPDGEALKKIADLAEQKIIVPVIDRTFSFAQGNEALAYVEKGRARGKVVVTIDE